MSYVTKHINKSINNNDKDCGINDGEETMWFWSESECNDINHADICIRIVGIIYSIIDIIIQQI